MDYSDSKSSKIFVFSSKSNPEQTKLRSAISPKPEVQSEEEQDGGGEFVYQSLRPIVVLGSYLGMMPLRHSMSKDGKNLQFAWFSRSGIASLLLLFYLTFVSVMSSYYYIFLPFSGKWGIETIAVRPRPMIFNISSALMLICSIYTAKKLPEVLRFWDECVMKIRKYLPTTDQTEIHFNSRKSLAIAIVLMTSAILEHVMHDVTVPQQARYNGTDYFRCYYVEGNEYLAAILEYNKTLTILIFVFNKFSTVAWNFQDVFITLVSFSLKSNFRVISGHVRKVYRECQSASQWQTVREDHMTLCDVVKMVDNVIGPAVLISYMVNLYFICVQIYFAIRPNERSLFESVYFSHSFFHLLLRIGLVSISAAGLYEEVRNPLEYLLRCPTSTYCVEIARFINHLSLSQVAITGCNFFNVNRSLFLSIIGVIFTYELILLNAS